MIARITLLAGVLLAIGLWVPTAAATPAATAKPVSIVASNWHFSPAKIAVELGEPTTLALTSTAGVHGLASPQLGIPLTTIMPGKIASVTFVPKKAGTYKVSCAIFCGAGHATMVLTIVVER